MGTHCYIGIEQSNGSVEYIYVHFDGYFEGIVPTLRHYTNRVDVEKMIKYGFFNLSDLQKIDGDIPNVIERPKIAHSMYPLIDLSRSPYVPYIYVFSQENEWLCYTSGYFQMKYLNCE